ncbi:hypothetical protein AGMMS50267_15040 [Spirochaetia bacterium]|nr:hypothetical protein AGMMS50267_15040 [Spirochaetia bacterium]
MHRMRCPLRRTALIPALFLSFSLCLFAEEGSSSPERPPYSALLTRYLARDAEGIRLESEKERAALKLQQYALEKGVSFTVSTGDVNFTFGAGGSAVEGRPGLEVDIPRAGDLAVTVNAPVSAGGGADHAGYGIDAGVRAGLITGRRDEEKALFLENEFAFRDAQWNVTRRRLAAEQEFCAAVKELLTLQNAVIEAQVAVLSARYDLESKKAGGYGASSVIIRTAELKLRRQERIRDEAERKMERALGKFAADCGIDHAEIPEDIPNEALANVSASDASLSVEVEKLARQQNINTLRRKAQDRFFTLSGSLGYVWESDAAVASGYLANGNRYISYAPGSSLRAGTGIGLGGVTLNTSVRLPLEDPVSPSLTVGLQWKSYGFKVFNIARKMRAIEAEQEKEAIVKAEKDFRDKAEDFNRRMADLNWQYEIMLQETELFRINMEEQQSWFGRGIIRELDYLDARNQYHLALNSLLSAKIDRRLYNIEAALLFVPEGR